MNLMWSVALAFATLATPGCAVVDKWEDVGFGLTQIASSSKLVVSNMETGCSIFMTSIELTCKDSNPMGNPPSNAFHTVVNCLNMDPTKASRVKIKGSDSCGKLTSTQYFAADDSVSTRSGSVEIQPGQLANLTCVLLPFPIGNSAEKRPGEDNFATSNDVKLDFAAQHFDKETKRLEGGSQSVSIGTVKFLQDPEKVTSSSCSTAVDKLFDWKLSLTNSNQNVHTFLWSSQNGEPSSLVVANLKTLPTKFTTSMKDLGFYDLQPSIHGAICGKSATNFGDKVKLQVEKLPKDSKVPEKHEEVVKMMVDATQLPTCSELEVEVMYTFPGQDARYVKFLLPVDNPNVPDDQPQGSEKSSWLGTVFWILLIGGVLALAVGGFLYRRNLLIQANARALP